MKSQSLPHFGKFTDQRYCPKLTSGISDLKKKKHSQKHSTKNNLCNYIRLLDKVKFWSGIYRVSRYSKWRSNNKNLEDLFLSEPGGEYLGCENKYIDSIKLLSSADAVTLQTGKAHFQTASLTYELVFTSLESN